jgi:glycosyltransferase involved in cell wall biosynthesis
MSERLPGILHIHANCDVIAGQEFALRLILDVLRNNARQYVLLPCERRLGNWLRELGYETVVMPLDPLTRRDPIPYLRSLNRLTRLIRSLGIDLVHASGAYPNQHGTPAARLTGRKALCVLHNTIYQQPELRRNFVPMAHRVVCVSDGVKESVRGFVPDRNLVTRYLGVDLKRFSETPSRTEIRRELGIPEDAILLGQFGQLIERKRTTDFVRAAGSLKDRYPKLFLLIVGEDHHGTGYRTEIEEAIVSSGLSDRALLTGFHGDIDRLYHALDLFVFPTKMEGLGLVLLEAMAASKPVVSTTIAGVNEVVEDGVTGLLVPPEEIGMLADAIAWMLDHPAERETMGRAGRARVEQKFDAVACMDAYRDLFLDLARSR